MLAEAFEDDPVLAAFIDERGDRRHRIALLFLAMIRSAGARGRLDLAVDDDGTVLGAAVWEGPKHSGAGLSLGLTTTSMMVRALGARGVARALRYERVMGRHRPGIAHWYLGELGVAAAGRGRGIGTALLAHGLARADAEDAAAYLESSTPRNRRLYRRNGFVELAPIVGIDGAEPAAMWRPARSTTARTD
ncbi:puromycin N-acetyltransferase, putative [Mycetocola reblochoni REB411]|uniref:Puromycin N-acetyltransferase, putative n=1 Tax=Mycetocola reblochoni REB411 TaxID=1255698 RepID=A0A1R4IVN5_9MICO|nr:puromycin N-acetyltransferase, putative [Mycetocola reblochoni REB411]